MSFSEKLQQLRKANKLSQEQLADMLDVTRQSVSKWESGTTYPEMDKLITMCKIFKCSLDDLTNDEISEINVEKKQGNNNLISNLVSSIVDIIDRSAQMFRAMSAKQIIGLIMTIVFIALFLLILRIPFEVLEQGFYGVVSNIPNRRVVGSIAGLFNMILDIIFFVLYVLALVYIYKVVYLDKYDYTKKVSSDEVNDNVVEAKNEDNNRKEVRIVQTKKHDENTIFSFLGNIVIWFFRILTAICIVPFIFTLVALFAVCAIAIAMMFEGVVYIGVILGIIFAIIINLWVLEVGCVFIFNKKASFNRLLWSLIVGLSGMGISLGLVALEIGSTTFIDEVPSEYELGTNEEECAMRDDLLIDWGHYYYRDVDYVVDESMVDNVSISVEHYEEINNPVIKFDENKVNIYVYYPNEFGYSSKLWKLVKSDLAKKQIRDYGELHSIRVQIASSSVNIEKIKSNIKAEYERNIKLEYDDYNYSLEVKIDNYESQIDSLREENEQLQERIEELEDYKNRVQGIIE